jgi:hypothetical protein
MSDRRRTIYKVEAGTSGPSTARRIVTKELSGRVSQPDLERLRLMVSEIVAERLGNVSPHETLLLELIDADVMRCGVVDNGRPSLPSGWRSVLLDRLASTWGLTCRNHVTEIWFETSVDEAGRSLRVSQAC